MKYLSFFLFCFLFLLASAVLAAPMKVEDVRLSSYATGVVRLVAETEQKPDCDVFKLNNPPRLVIDIKNAQFDKNALKKNGIEADFANLRLGTPNSKTCRLVLELPHADVETSQFHLAPEKDGNWRFVVDISNKTVFSTAGSAGTKPIATSAPAAKSGTLKPAPQPKKPTPKIDKTPRKKIIVLDPGHGGADPGAISASGRYEKDLTLKMAFELKSQLQEAGYSVVLTRDRDIAIPLRGRIERAHKANADLFISIHADSSKNKKATGLSIYTISERASDAEAAALADRENKADIILGLDLANYQPEVSNILIDLAKRDTMGKSSQYANFVVGEMRRQVDLVPNAHRYAGFVVLKSPNIPSVLLEMGYLSNKSEEKLLQQASYRSKLAKSMTRAVNNYFKEVSE